MPINIYSVANHLESEGWTLVSDVYKNLSTELEMICPAGHRQWQTYDKWRKHMICDTCMAGDPFKIKKNKVPPKQEGTYRVLALDAATGITGYALYDNKNLACFGTFKSNADLPPIERIDQVKNWLIAALKEWQPDLVGLENIQLQKFGMQAQVKTFQTLANLQGVLLDTIFCEGIPYELVYPSEWRSYCAINDGDTHREAKKKQAQAKVHLWYNIDCTEDEADAICIGKYFNKQKSTWGENI